MNNLAPSYRDKRLSRDCDNENVHNERLMCGSHFTMNKLYEDGGRIRKE